jgi:putative membrane-bound dehydrogenase-like protein
MRQILAKTVFIALTSFFVTQICAQQPPANPSKPASGLKSTTTHAAAYGPTRNAVNVDPAKDLPRYPAIPAKDATATWQVKPGFHLELAAHEPSVRDPIAICFDERGRLFVCEMIDYSERRDEIPHLGRVSVLEDKDNDGTYESATVFADNLAWPTGLIWSNGGLYVATTPDIVRFEDRDHDNRAEHREVVFTGFGTGLKLLNVQGMFNSLQWGQDNRIHLLAGGGNRGVISSPKNPARSAEEISGRDFWFDPMTHDFGFESGGAQYGMSFDDFGRKFACSNSDHLQHWIADDRLLPRGMQSPRHNIAADGGAAEVFRISPDEPWRIVRTRWRIAGVVKGMVEGGGRVSGYFTGATGTTIYRGDAFGTEFVNNSFTGDAGGQLVHRKVISPAADGVTLTGKRPDDETQREFAASTDTWVRVVNFANAPDGCLYICDMYREVIEHPWSIPDEIKKHLDLNSGNDRGRLWRITPDKGRPARGSLVNLGTANTSQLVDTLSHPNGWHRDTAHRLLAERRDPTSEAPLRALLAKESAVAQLHAIGALDAIGQLRNEDLEQLAKRASNHDSVRERAITLLASRNALSKQAIAPIAAANSPRLRFVAAAAAAHLPSSDRAPLVAEIVLKNDSSTWIHSAVMQSASTALFDELAPSLRKLPKTLAAALLSAVAKSDPNPATRKRLIQSVTTPTLDEPLFIALAKSFRDAGVSIAEVDSEGKAAAVFESAHQSAVDRSSSNRANAIRLLAFWKNPKSLAGLRTCLSESSNPEIQTIAVNALLESDLGEPLTELLPIWPSLSPAPRSLAIDALLSRESRIPALLAAIRNKAIAPSELSAAQVQTVVSNKNTQIAAAAKATLADVLPPARADVLKSYAPAATTKGDASKGRLIFQSRCMVCHKAGSEGFQVGPDLVTVKNRGREALLTAILDPDREVAAQYISYKVNKRDGSALEGLITDDSATGFNLTVMGGASIPLKRSEVQGTVSSGKSLMPEGLERGLSPKDMADLLDFIETLP